MCTARFSSSSGSGGLPTPSRDTDSPPGGWSCDLWCMLGSHCLPPPIPMDRMTGTCKNITLPQTSFAGGKKLVGTSNQTIGIGMYREDSSYLEELLPCTCICLFIIIFDIANNFSGVLIVVRSYERIIHIPHLSCCCGYWKVKSNMYLWITEHSETKFAAALG